MFDRNSLWFGILLGVVAPLLFYAMLYLLWLLFSDLFTRRDLDFTLLQIISPAINLFFIRYYFVKKKYDETGRGVLLVTFVYVIAFFVLNRAPGVGLTLFGG